MMWPLPVWIVVDPPWHIDAVGGRSHHQSHAASDLHETRRIEADRLFIEQHGEMAAIIRAAPGWLIDPQGRVRD